MRSPDVTASIQATTMDIKIHRILTDPSITNKARAIRTMFFESLGMAVKNHNYNNIIVGKSKITIVNRGRKKCET